MRKRSKLGKDGITLDRLEALLQEDRSMMIAWDGRRLRAALAAVLVPDNVPELRPVHEWLDSWSGIRLVPPALACDLPAHLRRAAE
jgi:hypothetical protein